MSDDDMIRRGEALKACHCNVTANNIRALPAVSIQPLIDAAVAKALEEAAGVKVKPLVWEDFDGLGAKASAFYQANYLIQWWRGEGRYEVALSYPGYQTGYDGDRWHDTLDAAKAAAQADYEARVLTALIPQSGTDALRQARVEGMRVCEQLARDNDCILDGEEIADAIAALIAREGGE
ncbi:hypothetical protein [Tabrizicola sp. M-4]|uniref:hypothetical protein n=1 Tax=Tabrizicola sp. M-4 TaxID=3055847 RepID=UPI003DA95C91